MYVERIDNKEHLDALAKELRCVITDIICKVGWGHLGGTLGLVEIIVTLYFRIMKTKPDEPRWEDRDRFVMSKGHAGPVLYAVLAYCGFFPKEWLLTLNKHGTRLPSHVDQIRTPGVDMTTGSLGQGLSAAVGIALACRLDKKNNTVFCVIGDGESQEGNIWEAAMFAAHNNLDNLVVITDYNKLQVDDRIDEINSLEPLVDKWKAFGWEVSEMNGHDWDDIYATTTQAIKVIGKPAMAIAHTVKAKGNVCYEDQVSCHSIKVPNQEEYDRLIKGLGDISDVTLPY